MIEDNASSGRLSTPSPETLLRQACAEPENGETLKRLDHGLSLRDRLPQRLREEHRHLAEAAEQLRRGQRPDLEALARDQDPISGAFQLSPGPTSEVDFLSLKLATAEELKEFASSGLSVRFLSLNGSLESFPSLPGLEGLEWHKAQGTVALPPLRQLLLIEPKMDRLPELAEPEKLLVLRLEAAGDMRLDFSSFSRLRHLSITGLRGVEELTLPPSTELEFLEVEKSGLLTMASSCPLEALAHLSLADNQFEALPNWLLNLSQLEFLKLDGNQFQSLPNLFDILPRLKNLHCSNNPMRPQRLPEILVPPRVEKEVRKSYLAGHIGLLAQAEGIVMQSEGESKELVYELNGEQQTWTVDWLTGRSFQPWGDLREPERYRLWRLDETRAVLFADTNMGEVYLCDLSKKQAHLLFATGDSEPSFHILEPGIGVVYDAKTCALLGALGQITKSPIREGKVACCGDRLYRLYSSGELRAYAHQNGKLVRAEEFEKAQFGLELPRWYREPPKDIIATELIVTADSPHIWGKFGNTLLAVWEKTSGACVFSGAVEFLAGSDSPKET